MATKKRLSRWVFGIIIFLGLVAMVFLVNVSKPGSQVIGCLQDCALDQIRVDDGTLRLMSLNILHGYPEFNNLQKRLQIIANEITRQGADLVCLQEAPWTPEFGYAAEVLAKSAGMNYAYLRANGNHGLIRFEEGVAILSRYPILHTNFTELEPRAGFFENRVVLHVVVAAPGGNLDIFVTHLTHGDDRINAGQAAGLHRYVEANRKGFAIIAGDFNAQDDERQIMDFQKRWTDAYREANPGKSGETCCVDELTAGPDELLDVRIDYIFIAPIDSQTYQLAGVKRVLHQPSRLDGGWLWASDHVGLLADIKLKR